LGDTSIVGGERADAIEHCLAGIVRLSDAVKDAATYLPGYDQRVYSEVCSFPVFGDDDCEDGLRSLGDVVD